MKVNDPNITGSPPDQVGLGSVERTRETGGVGRRGRVNTDTGDSPDSVALSDLGSRLRLLGTDAPERVVRLEKLAEAVESRRYSADAGAVSQKLVDEALKPKE